MHNHNLRYPKTDSTVAPEAFEEVARDMRRILKESHAALRGNSAKLDALIKHLNVPYEKGPRKKRQRINLGQINFPAASRKDRI